MKTLIDKKSYNTPHIECVELDSAISLALESAPPEGPNEVINHTPAYFNNNPFNDVDA